MAELNLFAGFDIGGTSANYCIENSKGEILLQGKQGGLNFSTVSIQDYIEYLKKLFNMTHIDQSFAGVYCAIAGLKDAVAKQTLSQMFSTDKTTFYFDDDVSIFFKGMPNIETSALFIAGTGSIIALFQQNKHIRFGGDDRFKDPFNGAFTLGHRFLQSIKEDLRLKTLRYDVEMYKSFSLDIISQIYDDKNAYLKIATYAKVLLDLCGANDHHAKVIVNECFDTIQERLEMAKAKGVTRIFLYGGLLKHSYFNKNLVKLLSNLNLAYEIFSQPIEILACEFVRSLSHDH